VIAPLLALIAAFTVPSASPPPLAPSDPSTDWSTGSAVSLTWDVAHGRPAEEQTIVHVMSDSHYLYVRFDAKQSVPVIATQHADDTVVGGSNVNGGIAWTDDAVWVDLWPGGAGGFHYQFESNPVGAHNESSSENSNFAPQWQSHGEVTSGGYTVTMAIPMSVIRGAHAGAWRVQFVRYVRSTGALDVWSYDPSQTNPDDFVRAGTATLTSLAKPPLPPARFSPYALAEGASRAIGGSTSRVGMDFSIPVTPTASFFGTFHPDYSNVELDQVSISPTVYQRTYNEVRPFFTQAGQYFGLNCDVCSGYTTNLYTFGIPTPREGYAFEGKQGPIGLATFDAIGDNRTDAATALNYTSSDDRWQGTFQHVQSGTPAYFDATNTEGINWSNGKDLSAYVNNSADYGTFVNDPSQGRWTEGGGGYLNQSFGIFGSLRRVGAQYQPVDGFASHPGIGGYAVYAVRIWSFAKNDALSSIGISGNVDRYQGPAYGIAQSDNGLTLDLLTKKAWDLQLYTGSDYWRFGSVLTPVSQNGGFALTYHSGMQKNVGNFPQHGSSSTPTQIQYFTGRYGLGRLDTWYRSSTMRLGQRGYLTFTLDNTAQWMREHGPDNVQWFEGIAYSYQIDRSSSFAVGVRRIVGTPPVPNGGGDCVGMCSNVSLAYHLRLPHEEFYLAYGDPNTLTTIPQTIFKVIFYAGAQKGT
jgi:hypothetical protein